jgi:hypothetical protein
LNADKANGNSWKGTSEEVGRGTRPTAAGTAALPNPCSLVRESAENVKEPETATRPDALSIKNPSRFSREGFNDSKLG